MTDRDCEHRQLARSCGYCERDAEIERLTASLVHWKRLAEEASWGEMLALKEKHKLRAKLAEAEREGE